MCMIIFTDQELEYIKMEFEGLLDVLQNGSENTVIVDYVEGLDDDTTSNMHTILSMMNLINNHIEVNKLTVDTVYYGLGMSHWLENGMLSADEVREFVDDEFYLNIYQKIINEEE